MKHTPIPAVLIAALVLTASASAATEKLPAGAKVAKEPPQISRVNTKIRRRIELYWWDETSVGDA